MAADELVELKFRLADGSDIGPSKYNSSATVTSLKEKIIAQWPKDKENGPKSVNDIKLINAGRILENNRTLAESRLPLSEVPGGVITMHVVVRPPVATSHARRSRRSDAAAMTTEYPPPIPLLAHMENVSSHVPWVMNSYRTSDGRLVITEERAPRHEYFQVLRSDGRLVLNRFQGEYGGFQRENQHWG